MSVTETRDTTATLATAGEPRRKTVAVLGAGIAGLTAAQELAERGYDVTVFEARGADPDDLGGKARSFVDRDAEGRKLFGEHGFRFFPGFYRHVIDTMRRIPSEVGGSVYDRLTDLPWSAFYARCTDQGADEPPRHRSLLDPVKAHAIWLFLAWLLVLGPWIAYRHPMLLPLWLGAGLAWYVVRIARFILGTGDRRSCMELEIPTRTSRDHASREARSVFIRCWWARLPGVVLPLAALALVHHPLRLLPFALIAAFISAAYPVLATVRSLWRVLQLIPPDVRPGILESIAASFKIAAVVASCDHRTYRQWEQENWWSFINAYRYSRPFQLAFATGLTRSFVATRAERMSARTGASILAQLLYDIAPTLYDRDAADRVLNLPTHLAWIHPWITLLQQQGVRFNQVPGRGRVDRVEVRRLIPAEPVPRGRHPLGPLDSPRIAGFTYVDPSAPGGEATVLGFDHHVLALSGIGARRVLEASDEVLRWDRRIASVAEIGSPNPGRTSALFPDRRLARDERTVPFLDSVFGLDFGWMTGIVYHLDQPLDLPQGHHLCLESEWALTAIDYGPIWNKGDAFARPGCVVDISPWASILSVNVSDWFTPAPTAPPAHLGPRYRVAEHVWEQLGEHIPALRGLPVPPWSLDPAIRPEADLRIQAAVVPPDRLHNDEQLLVNTARSWLNRPTAQTSFENLVIAGDYVRTSTDFASMESANESGRRATNVILARDGADPATWSVVHERLPEPAALRRPIALVRAADALATRLGLPHPLMAVATPIGWFAGAEQWLRHHVRREPPTAFSWPVEPTRQAVAPTPAAAAAASTAPTAAPNPDRSAPAVSPAAASAPAPDRAGAPGAEAARSATVEGR